MPEDTFDPWHFSSGLIDDCDITIREAYFAFDPNYQQGEALVLKMEVDTDDDDEPKSTLMFPCGKGWEPKDKGARAGREDGRQKPFNKSSGIALLCAAAIETGAGDIIKDRGDPMQANIWEGLSFHMKRRRIDYGGEIGEIERLLPTEFHGDKSKGAKTGGGSKPAASAASTTKEDTPADEPAADVPALKGALKVKLMKLAKECDDHDTFLEKAYETEGVDGNPAAEAAVESPDGLYAEARKGLAS
jgi:hypothetical protein